MRRCVHIRIYGLVQGVWFRDSTRRRAVELGLTGTVCNKEDGSVFVEAQGPNAAVDAFIAWCRKGPPAARVDRMDIAEGTPLETTEFAILR